MRAGRCGRRGDGGGGGAYPAGAASGKSQEDALSGGPLAVFAAAAGSSFSALLGVFLVVAAAAVLVRLGVVRDQDIGSLSSLTVRVFLPCLIFANVVTTLDPASMPLWWALPLVAVAMPAVGLGLAALLFLGRLRERRNMLAVASMQNAGFLVLPVGLALYPADFDRFALYCFLFILGFNPVLWSVGKLLATDSRRDEPWWRALLTPPLLANLAAVSVVLGGAGGLVPTALLDAVGLIGKAAVPVATFVLGAVLGSAGMKLRGHVADAVRAAAVKLVALPALTVLALLATGIGELNPLLARFLVVQSAAAPAAGLILQARSYGGDAAKLGSVMVLCYAGCAVTMPLWLAVWAVVGGG